jgi:hypothetical protein
MSDRWNSIHQYSYYSIVSEFYIMYQSSMVIYLTNKCLFTFQQEQ